ncbi:MAG: hypothetical protein ACD_58C00093G0004 [uncultured bacterium]|nr:MAG: hypothetical protein ACD_58C00093G0004 [uncultured bacterium]
MNWIKNKRNNYYRNPKIYTTTSSNGEGVYLSKKSVGLIGIVIITAIFLWWVFGSGFFKVKEIIIKGSLNAEVQSEIESFKGKNILTFVLGNTEEKLAQKQSSIKEINILRGIPNTLKIDVTVRKPIFSWKSQDKTYLVDDGGIAFLEGDGVVVNEEGTKLSLLADTNNMPVEPSKQIVTKEFVSFINDLIKYAPEKSGVNIGEMRIFETTFELEADTDQGYKIKLDTTRNVVTQLEVLKKIVDQYRNQIKEYVDLRVEGRVYYK